MAPRATRTARDATFFDAKRNSLRKPVDVVVNAPRYQCELVTVAFACAAVRIRPAARGVITTAHRFTGGRPAAVVEASRSHTQRPVRRACLRSVTSSDRHARSTSRIRLFEKQIRYVPGVEGTLRLVLAREDRDNRPQSGRGSPHPRAMAASWTNHSSSTSCR